MKRVLWMYRDGEIGGSMTQSRKREKDGSSACGITLDEGTEIMEKVSEAAQHLSLGQIKTKMKMTSGFWKLQKWLVIYNALIDPRPASEIAKHTGVSEATVRRILAEYNALGPDAIDSHENKNGHRCCTSSHISLS